MLGKILSYATNVNREDRAVENVTERS